MKRVTSALIMAVVCAAIMQGCSSQELKIDKNGMPDGMDLMRKSAEFYKNADNYEIEQAMNINLSFADPASGSYRVGSAAMEMNTVVFSKPFKFKSIGNISYDIENVDSLDKGMDMDQYGVVSGNDITIYHKIAGQWYQTSVKTKEFIDQDTQGINYVTNYKSYVKSVLSVSEDAVDGISAYRASYSMNPDYMLEVFDQYGYSGLVTASDDGKRNEKIVKLMENVTFDVWFDKDNYAAVKMYIDMSPVLERVGELLADQIGESLDESTRKMLIDAFKSSKVDNTLYYKNVNQCEDYEIPEEVLDAPVF